MKWSNKAYYPLFILPLLAAAALFVGMHYGKNELLGLYLYRLGLLPSAGAPLHIPMPEVIPRSGPTEKILGRILLLFSWDLDGTLEHPVLGSLPFHLSLSRDKGDFSITTKNGGLKANWRGKKRWIQFDRTPLSLLSSLPEGEIQGEWADERGHKGSVLVSLKGGETISIQGEGKKVLITSLGFKLEGDLEFDLPIGKPPTLTLKNGFGRLGKQWGLKEIAFDSSQGVIQGQLQQEEMVNILPTMNITDGFGHFLFDVHEKKVVGTDFEATLTFLNEEKKALFPYWEADRAGGAFEVWIEREGLIKGSYRNGEIHLFEGSFLGGIEMGPLKLSSDRIEGSIRSDLVPLLEKWSAWSLFPLPPLPDLEGKLDGELLLTAEHGECRLEGENLRLGPWPISSVSFEIVLEPDALHVKEGSVEECLFSFDLVKQGSDWKMPSFALIWRDFLKGTATGERTKEGAHLVFDHLSVDLTLLESIPSVQEILHQFDLTGFLKGSGEVFYSKEDWKGRFKIRGEEWMSGEKALPFLQEVTIEMGDLIRFSGGAFQLDRQLLTIEEGTIGPNGISCQGKGLFSIPWMKSKTLAGPWKYQEGLFSGVVDLPPYGLVQWEKDFVSPIFLSTPLYGIHCEIDGSGCLKGKWGDSLTFEMTLYGDGKGDGKAHFLGGLPLPKVAIDSPLPLEVGWIYPSIGTLPFRLSDEGLIILPGGELFSEGKGIKYEKVEGSVGWKGELNVRLLPKASRLPLYWLERGEISILGSIEEPKVEVKWR